MFAQVFIAREQGFGQARVFGGGFTTSGCAGHGFRTYGTIEKGEQRFRRGPDQGTFGLIDEEGVTLGIAAP